MEGSMSSATVRNILALITFSVFVGGALFVVVVHGLGLMAMADMKESLQTWSQYLSGFTGLIIGYYFRLPGGKSSTQTELH